MNIARITTSYRGSEWRQRFADRMIAICPTMNPDAIDEIADAQYAHSNEIEPEVAAEQYAQTSGFAALDEIAPKLDASDPLNRASGG